MHPLGTRGTTSYIIEMGIWCGFTAMVTACLGVAATRGVGSRCLHLWASYLVMGVVSCVLMGMLILLQSVQLYNEIRTGLNGLLLVIALIECKIHINDNWSRAARR